MGKKGVPIYSSVPHHVLVLSPCFISLANPKSVIEICPIDWVCERVTVLVKRVCCVGGGKC